MAGGVMRSVLAVLPAPTFGGSANQILRLHQPLRERGWELIAVIPDAAGNIEPRLGAAGVTVVQVPMHRLRATTNPRSHAALLRNLGPEVGKLRGLVRRFDAAVVQNHGDLNPHAALAGHLEGRAVHWQILDTRTPPVLRRPTGLLMRWMADSVTTVGRALADSHPGATAVRERCLTVFPPLDAAAFTRAPERRQAARAELGLSDADVCVGAIGNRNPQKGQDWLVRAVAAAGRQRGDLVVRILGAPSPGHEDYEANLRAEAAAAGLREPDRFALADPGDRVAELIGAFDALVMPSVPNSEGMPTVILEAMAAGVPVVATDVGATREMLRDHREGRIVAPCEPGALAAALLDVLGPNGAGYVAAARERVLAEFTLDRLADLYARAYEVAVEHRAGR